MKTLDRALDKLNQVLLEMADVVEKNMEIANKYYFDRTSTEKVNDDKVDMYERFVEEMVLDIMIKERPYASDLRILTGILTLVEDIERIGDHAEDIYNFTSRLIDTNSNIVFDIKDISDLVVQMFHHAIRSFIDKDEKLALEVINLDDTVDKLYEEKLNELIEKWNNKDDSSFAIYNTLVIKYLERIADHSVNICEWVIYIIRGYYKDKQIF